MNNLETVIPDFEKRSYEIINISNFGQWINTLMTLSCDNQKNLNQIRENIKEALEQCFNQGRSIGYREGYEKGGFDGWQYACDEYYKTNGCK